MSEFIGFQLRHGLLALTTAALLALAPSVSAQAASEDDTDAARTQQTQTDDTRVAGQTGPPDTPRPGVVPPAAVTAERDQWWEFVGGYEADSLENAYGFAGPSFHKRLRDDLALKFRVHASHLEYEFENGLGGMTEVSAPGIGPAIGLKFGRRNTVSVSAGVNFRRYQREIGNEFGTVTTERDTDVGLSLGADGSWHPTRRSNVTAMLHYGTRSDYTWGRLAAKHQVSNFSWRSPLTMYLGVEGTGQGNEDIRSLQIGGLGELLIHRSNLSLQGRAGYKRSSFDRGPDKDGPYFGLGLWKRF